VIDDERRIEQSKVAVRWLVAGVLFVAALYLRRSGAVAIPLGVIVGLAAVVAAVNIAFSAILRRGAPGWLRYVTTGTDLILASVFIAASGASLSPFYYVYFIILVSNSIRYGMRMAAFVATVVNIGYVLILTAYPPAGDLTPEGVKILAFWGVALYAGYLATRFQRQARILEAYEETIAGLREELRATDRR
jgi:hypothetical protein